MLDAMRVFVHVADTGSFSKTAARLQIAPSSVSRTIDQLEKQLQVTLFKRSTRQVVLTEKGQLFLRGALPLLEEANALVASVQDRERVVSGELRISVFESFGRLVVSPLIATFLRKYPDVTVTLELDNGLTDLTGDNVDLAIRIGLPMDSGLRYRRLLPNRTRICASPQYLAAQGTPTVPEELVQHNCLLLRGDRQRSYWYFRKHDQMQKITVSGNLRSKGGTPLLEAAKEGLGIVQLLHWMAADALAQGTLVPLLEDWTPSLSEHSSGEIYALYQNTRFPNPLIRVFLDFLMEQMTHRFPLHTVD
ncbi:predicted protein [Nematostella vectensis]|uniref:HTH lysR-type domain-containing protein n=1 Tax=Nematostella vectensis TaxID=45351 RepID=A8DVY1_NEMVE|nr:predicted protein [Nematostella vectensis]|eukprot:XP_001617728.1 hypothetical protein NEMVEDRAFT_v1g156874 [Nematostella vectensis]